MSGSRVTSKGRLPAALLCSLHCRPGKLTDAQFEARRQELVEEVNYAVYFVKNLVDEYRVAQTDRQRKVSPTLRWPARGYEALVREEIMGL